jgi:hypothetical protein
MIDMGITISISVMVLCFICCMTCVFLAPKTDLPIAALRHGIKKLRDLFFNAFNARKLYLL